MDQHPIPQDVTGFQFKLVGAMTVKQFGYVASGVIMAVILYYLPLHSAFGIIMKVLFVPLFGASGVIVAFVPLEGRPIDVMATNFVKALFSPNQYIYHRQGKRLSFSTVTVVKAPISKKTHQQSDNHSQNAATRHDQKEEKLRELLLSSHDKSQSELDKKETAFLNTLSTPAVQNSITPGKEEKNSDKKLEPIHFINKSSIHKTPTITSVVQNLTHLQQSHQTQENPPTETEKTDPTLVAQPIQNKQSTEITSPSPLPGASEHKATVLSQQITQIHEQKQQLEQELSHLKTQLATQKASPTPTANPVQPVQDPQHVRTIPQAITKKVGLPHVSDSPNVVVGIVKDPRGNILANILVEVKDKDGNPVRAFKTNQLGQFASATPLSTGTYTIELDDPKKQHTFDVIQIVANNQVLLPIEIISHDAREELRKQLFTN